MTGKPVIEKLVDGSMARCCVESFARSGIITGFALAKSGDQHQCQTCGRVYQLLVRMPGQRLVWTLTGQRVSMN